jgi:hypothetical protein
MLGNEITEPPDGRTDDPPLRKHFEYAGLALRFPKDLQGAVVKALQLFRPVMGRAAGGFFDLGVLAPAAGVPQPPRKP